MQYLIEKRIEELREKLSKLSKPGTSFSENLKIMEERNSLIFSINEFEMILEKAKDKKLA
jgi:hypothetical protein